MKPERPPTTPPRTSADTPPEPPALDPALEDALNRAIGRLARSIRRWLGALTIVVIVLSLGVGGLGVYVLVKASETRNAICHLRQDLQQRIAQGEDFIAHPDHYPGVKIDPKVIRAQVEGQKRTVESLTPLGCDDAPVIAPKGQ